MPTYDITRRVTTTDPTTGDPDVRWDPIATGLPSREEALALAPPDSPWRVMARSDDGLSYEMTDSADPSSSGAGRPVTGRRRPPISGA